LSFMSALYQRGLKPMLFRFDPEVVHDTFVKMGEMVGRYRISRTLIGLVYDVRGKASARVVDGIRYRTPVLLAAGFDYNGRLTRILPRVGFAGEEIGSVTARPTEGNPRPRLTRLVRSHSLVVNKGLRNDGVEALIQLLKRTPRHPDFVLGISIARTNDAASAKEAAGIEDYFTTLRRLVEEEVGDFYTINISCPNVHGGESFTDAARLEPLLARLATVQHDRPMYVKMPINLSWEAFAELLEIVDRYGLHGVVIGNLNKQYEELDDQTEAPATYRGGLSGRPCSRRSTDLIRRTREMYGTRFTIMGCGGILSVEDAMEKLEAGADLLQLVSGMIFEGPHLIKAIAAADAGAGRRLHVATSSPAGELR
jgi:dihydroorotate dehydrogenase